jgi:prepilin signal peptidase PulO-like enzyme (type II secretory pathway)
VLPLTVAAIAGIAVGWVSWLVAATLTPEAHRGLFGNGTRRHVPLLISCVIMGSLATIASVRSGGDFLATTTFILLAAPLLVTLLTDIRARLVFPAVLAPGLLAALVVATAEPGRLLAVLITGAVAGGVVAVLVLLSRWLWSGSDETPLGSGEILIVATIGAMLGPDRTPIVLFAGMGLAAAVAGLLLLTGRAQRAEPMPYGACLCAAGLVALAM